MTKKKLRSVDLLLTKLTIAEKFHILFWFPLILLILIALLLMQQNRNMRIEDNQRAMQQSLQQSAALIASLPDTPPITLPDGLTLSTSGQTGSVEDNGINTITVAAGKHGYLSGRVDARDISIWDNQGGTVGLILAGLFVMAAVIFFTSAFIQRSLGSLTRALHRLAEGDLTERLHFTLSRDEFSRVAANIDQLAERQQKTVRLVHDSLTIPS